MGLATSLDGAECPHPRTEPLQPGGLQLVLHEEVRVAPGGRPPGLPASGVGAVAVSGGVVGPAVAAV